MNARDPLRPVLESLDTRCLPSGLGIHPAAEVSILAAKSKVLNLNGNLRGTASLPPATSGVQFVSVVVSGKLAKTAYALNTTARVELFESTRTPIMLKIGATKGRQFGVLDIRLTVPAVGGTLGGPLNYTITGGTKFLKGSTGTGTISFTLPQGPPTGPQTVPIILTFRASGR